MAAVAERGGATWNEELVDLYREHCEGLVRVAQRIVWCHAQAEAIVHDVFLAFHAKDAGPQLGRELAYLRSMVRNRARSVVRRSLRGAELVRPEIRVDASVEEQCESRFAVAELRAAMARLPERQQQVLRLRHQHGLTEAEIAETLGISRGSVKVHASRGRDALRRRLETPLVA